MVYSTEILKHPCGHNCEFSKETLAFFASKVFESLRNNAGDMNEWWQNEDEGRGYWVDNDDFLVKEGSPHFWRRIEVIDLTGDDIIDLTGDDIIDLTEDDIIDLSEDTEDETEDDENEEEEEEDEEEEEEDIYAEVYIMEQ